MGRLWQDLRFGFRMLIKHPTLSIISIITFGLGIGLTTTVFSVVNGALFKGLPFEEADRLVALAGTNPSRNIPRMPVSIHDFVVWQERQTVFESLGAWSIVPINLSWQEDRPERYSAGAFTVGTFDALGVKPLLGRTFRSGEDLPGADPVIVLSHEVWLDRFGGSPDVIGRTVRASGVSRTIIGVMPEKFAFPNRERLWIPLTIDPLATKRGQGPNYQVLARLKKGVSLPEARAQAAAIAAQLEKDYPEINRGIGATVAPFAERTFGPEIFALLYTMLGAGIGVLLIACVNVSNLLLARISLRLREVAVRVAMGAGRGRIILQLFAEVLILAGAGAGLGMVLSSLAMEWFLNAISVNPPPFWITFETDIRVMLFVAGSTLAASFLACIVPSLQAARTNVSEVLKDEGRGSSGFHIGRFSGALVVAEVAVSCGLLIAAGLMIKSVVQLKTLNLPFAVENILTARINLPRLQYPDAAACVRFYERLLPGLQEIPGVEAATLSDGLPAAGNGTIAIQVEGGTYSRDTDYPIVREGIVTPGYFQTFRTKVLRGREFSVSDRQGNQPVAMINESFARTHFPDQDPLGRRMKRGRSNSKEPWLTIVGIVPDMLMQGLGNNNQSPVGYYIPIAQSEVTNFVSIALRTRGDPGAVTPAVRSAVTALDKDLAIYQALSMKEVIRVQSWFYTVFGSFFMAFGCSALFLAMAGLYGVMSFAVSRRKKEMGIRMALGAQGGQLVRLIMRRAVIQMSLGLGLGLAIGLLAAGPLQPILYKVAPRDPIVMVIVVVALAAAGFLASFLPARRVTRINPVLAISTE
jgi:putative ABC transport system permease protein